MKRKLAIIGIGSAGIHSLCHFLAWLEGWEVTSIHDPSIDILGIGESTNPPFYESMQNGLNFHIIEDLPKIDGTIKFGSEFVDWRENRFTNPLVGGLTALHINTFKLAEFALPRLREIWGDKFNEVRGNVSEVFPDGTVVVDGAPHYFDYVMDCRGFTKDFSNYTMIENMPVNHALIHNTPPTVTEAIGPYTTEQVATRNGWMFVVPLLSRTSYGYLFNDEITTIDNARSDFSNTIGVEEIDRIEYKFSSYYINSLVNGRVFTNGNAAAFIEPLFANSQWIYNSINRLTFSYMIGEFNESFINDQFREVMEAVDTMIAYHYHGGSIYDTEFWRYAKDVTYDKAMRKVNEISPRLRYYTDNKFLPVEGTGWVFSPKSLYEIDRNFGYRYFT